MCLAVSNEAFLSLIDQKENLAQQAGRSIPSHHLCNSYIGHFQGLLHSYTRSSKFHRYLNIYFRSTLPPLEKVKYGSADRKPEDGKLHLAILNPHKELHRLGYLPKYSSMLVDLAYERIERLVKGETDLEEDVGMDGEQEEEEPNSWSRPMLATLRKEVQRQVVTWLYTYISGQLNRLFRVFRCLDSFFLNQRETREITSGRRISTRELSMLCNRLSLNTGKCLSCHRKAGTANA